MLLLSDRAKLVAQGVNVDSVVAEVATRLRAMAGVARVDRPAAFSAKDTADPVSRRWMHQVTADGGVELVVTLKPYSIWRDRKSTRLNSSHSQISYAVFCLKK